MGLWKALTVWKQPEHVEMFLPSIINIMNRSRRVVLNM